MNIKQLKDELKITHDAVELEREAMNNAVPHSNLWHVHRGAFVKLATEEIELEQKIGVAAFWLWLKIVALIVLLGVVIWLVYGS